MTEVRNEPCSSCPYRKDVPSGVWAHHEYEKLREYDAETMEQPFAPFMCHATPDHYCSGWAACHTNRGTDDPQYPDAHPYYPIALRMQGMTEKVPLPTTCELFSSGNEAADHGQRDINNPSQEAMDTVDKLGRKYPRLSVKEYDEHGGGKRSIDDHDPDCPHCEEEKVAIEFRTR